VFDHLAGSRYIELTTFRSNGAPVPTVVWHVLDDGVLYVHTGDQTGKAKRLRDNGRAQIAPSNARGRVTGEPIQVTGAPINGAGAFHPETAFKQKYGWQFRAVGLTSGLRRKKIGKPTFFRFEIDSGAG